MFRGVTIKMQWSKDQLIAIMSKPGVDGPVYGGHGLGNVVVDRDDLAMVE
jgi:hypothetical protein